MPADDELVGELHAPAGDSSGISVKRHTIGLRYAAARTLYNLLDEAGARGFSRNGHRVLWGPGMGCVTDGLDTYCELYGRSEAGSGDYEAILHGNAYYSAAAGLYSLIANGSADAFVSTPWFACERTRYAVWCGVEASETLSLEFTGLEDSGDDFVYEGWAVNDGVATTTDRFRNGPVLNQRVPRSIAADSLYVLTIEPRRGDDASPAATHLLAGALSLGGQTDLTTNHPAALDTDFTSAAGGFILATPTSAATDDETNGIWFVDPVVGAPSLSLPSLPAGWAYEGWVVTADGPISTGRFTDLAMADSDGPGPSAGPQGAPPFPGQDFVSPPTDLVGATVVISVEPQPDNSPAPFAIKPLIAGSVTGVTAPDLQLLDNTSDNRPSATAFFGI